MLCRTGTGQAGAPAVPHMRALCGAIRYSTSVPWALRLRLLRGIRMAQGAGVECDDPGVRVMWLLAQTWGCT